VENVPPGDVVLKFNKKSEYWVFNSDSMIDSIVEISAAEKVVSPFDEANEFKFDCQAASKSKKTSICEYDWLQIAKRRMNAKHPLVRNRMVAPPGLMNPYLK
jgi:hypothetical protein